MRSEPLLLKECFCLTLAEILEVQAVTDAHLTAGGIIKKFGVPWLLDHCSSKVRAHKMNYLPRSES